MSISDSTAALAALCVTSPDEVKEMSKFLSIARNFDVSISQKKNIKTLPADVPEAERIAIALNGAKDNINELVSEMLSDLTKVVDEVVDEVVVYAYSMKNITNTANTRMKDTIEKNIQLEKELKTTKEELRKLQEISELRQRFELMEAELNKLKNGNNHVFHSDIDAYSSLGNETSVETITQNDSNPTEAGEPSHQWNTPPINN